MKTMMSDTTPAAGSVVAILPHNGFITAPQFVALEATDTLVDAFGDGRQESVGGEERTT